MSQQLSDRFEPEPDKPYGYCTICAGQPTFASSDDASRHMNETLRLSGGTNSHTVMVTNPPRERRINSAIRQELDVVLSPFLASVCDLISHDHITREEATVALAHLDLGFVADALDEYLDDYVA